MNEALNHFVEILAKTEPKTCVFNQYSYTLSSNSIRRNNLSLYLQQMVSLKPQILLVGEAPGYRGCRLTGVPFTSEFILLNGVQELRLFGQSRGYQKTGESEKSYKESSASILWETLREIPDIPLIWNAFPFHPFPVGNEQANRKPTAMERATGQEFLQTLIQLFEIKLVIAVGNTAEATLKPMGIPLLKVRHPAYGGKPEFTLGVKKIMQSLHRNPGGTPID